MTSSRAASAAEFDHRAPGIIVRDWSPSVSAAAEELRNTVESLSIEIDAVAEALEGAPAPAAARDEAARAAAARASTERS